jgi:hypothetical protein
MKVHAPAALILNSAAATFWPLAVPPCSRAPTVAYAPAVSPMKASTDTR